MNVMKEYHAPHEKILFNYRTKDGDGYTNCPHCKKFLPMDLYFKNLRPILKHSGLIGEKATSIDIETGIKEEEPFVSKTMAGRYNIQFLYAVCPECGNHFDKEEYKVVILDRDYNALDYKTLDHVYIVNDISKRGQKLLTIINVFTVYTCWNNKMQYKKIAYKIIFNLETGMTYMTSMYYLHNKKQVYPQEKKYRNVTFYIDNYMHSSKKIAEIIRESLIEAKREFCPYLKEPKEGADLSQLTMFNRMPSVEYHIAKNVLDTEKSRRLIYPEIRSIKSNTTDFYGDVFRKLKVKPSKTLRRYISSGGSYTSLKTMLKAFKQVDSIAKLNDYDIDKKDLPFLKALIDAYGETNTVNKLLECDRSSRGIFAKPFHDNNRKTLNYHFTDSAYMWNQIISYGETYDFPKKSTLKEIHDDLTIQENKLRKKNKELKYEDYEIKRFHKETDRFILRFAKETHELIEVGSKMGICVGSYDTRAYQRQCDILLVIDKTNNYYVCCIERRQEKLEQIKACGNKVPEGELYDFIEEWLKETKVEPGYDWQRAVSYRQENKTQYIHTGQKGAYFANVEVPTQEEYDKQRDKNNYIHHDNWAVHAI